MRSPSDEQRQAIDQDGLFVLRACPGSGKTFTVAHRLAKRLKEWNSPHAGIATLSFTNVAREEISSQLQSLALPAVPGYPHVLGTIDHFVNTCIFLPFGHLAMGCGHRPAIVGLSGNPWSPVGKGWLWGKQKCYDNGCQLIDFTCALDGRLINLRRDTIQCPYERRMCKKLKKRFVEKGYASQSDANYWAVRVLEEYPRVARAIANRYRELIIDEAQDTSDTQMRIVDLLVDQGLSEVMLVGDPDQAIYEWRDARPDVFISKMQAECRGWQQLSLTENLRSSQYICHATKHFSTLPAAAKAVGPDAGFPLRPQIIEYDPSDVGCLTEFFIQYCRKALCLKGGVQPDPNNAAILVRGHALLRRIVGLGPERDPWNDVITRLLAQASYHRDNLELTQAIDCVESALGKVCFGDRAHTKTEARRLVDESVGLIVWRTGCLGLLRLLPPAEVVLYHWVADANSALHRWSRQSAGDLPVSACPTLGVKTYTQVGRKRVTDYFDWPVSSFFAESSFERGVTVQTVHAAKGKTYEAVMFVVTRAGKCTVRHLAERPPGDEEIRTAYVAITRPRTLLLVAVPERTDRKLLHRFPEWMVREDARPAPAT